ncbi:hypothetical protein D3C77_570080 [compost metagenome]
MQVDEIRVGGIQRVGVGAIGSQHQFAVGPLDGLWSNWTAGDAVSALGVVIQHVAGQGQVGFGRGDGVGIVNRKGHIVDNIDVDVGLGGAAIGIDCHHFQAFEDVVGAIAALMCAGVFQRIAGRYDTRAWIVAVDGEGVTHRRRAMLREASDHTATDNAQATNGQ